MAVSGNESNKIDMTNFSTNIGGGGLNTAMNFANLGLKTSAIYKVGKDIYSDGIFEALKQTRVNLEGVIQNRDVSTGFSIILVSFQGDRTVLAHRGANASINIDDINVLIVYAIPTPIERLATLKVVAKSITHATILNTCSKNSLKLTKKKFFCPQK